MAKDKPRANRPKQLRLLLPDRRPIVGLPAPARMELLDVIAQLLLQAESLERAPKEVDGE